MILRSFPEDFVVDEIPAFTPLQGGPYSIYRLWKRNFNTEDAIQFICKRFNIRRSDVKFAGAKDRNAVTTQFISIYRNDGALKIDNENIKLDFVCYSREPVSLGSSKGNSFTIILRDLSMQELERFKSLIGDAADSLVSFLIPNYFDEQRFSKNNVEIGLCMLKADYKGAVEHLKDSAMEEGYYEKQAMLHLEKILGDYVGALRKIPQKILLMYLHAVQSYLYNESLALLIKNSGQGYSEITYSQGKLVFYTVLDQYKSLQDKSIALVGFHTTELEPAMKESMTRLGIKPRDFIIRAIPELSLEGDARSTLMQVTKFSYTFIDETTLKLSFDLPKGSYATMVMKGLFS